MDLDRSLHVMQNKTVMKNTSIGSIIVSPPDFTFGNTCTTFNSKKGNKGKGFDCKRPSILYSRKYIGYIQSNFTAFFSSSFFFFFCCRFKLVLF